MSIQPGTRRLVVLVLGMFATVFLFVIVLPVLREGRGCDVEST